MRNRTISITLQPKAYKKYLALMERYEKATQKKNVYTLTKDQEKKLLEEIT